MIFLRQSTAATVRIGSFVDATDGVTPETGVTLGAADQAEILKSGGGATVDISGATWAAITGCDGWYNLSLTTSHTDTVGGLRVIVQDSSVCLPVEKEFYVLEEAVYDLYFAASATGSRLTGDAYAHLVANLGTNGANATAIVEGLPTYDELTAQINAIASLINALNDPSIAEMLAGFGLATGNLDTQLAAIAASIGGGDATAANQAAILARLSAVTKVYANPRDPNRIEIIRGDAYDGTSWPVFTWTVNKDCTNATITLTIRHAETDAVLFSTTGTGTATGCTVSLTTTNTTTAALVAGTHKFDVEIRFSAESAMTPGLGICEVFDDQSR